MFVVKYKLADLDLSVTLVFESLGHWRSAYVVYTAAQVDPTKSTRRVDALA